MYNCTCTLVQYVNVLGWTLIFERKKLGTCQVVPFCCRTQIPKYHLLKLPSFVSHGHSKNRRETKNTSFCLYCEQNFFCPFWGPQKKYFKNLIQNFLFVNYSWNKMKVFANVNKYSLFRSLNIFLMMKTLPRVRCAQQKSRMIKMRLESMTGSWPSFTQYSMIFKIRFVIPLIVVTVWKWYKQSGNYCRMFIGGLAPLGLFSWFPYLTV